MINPTKLTLAAAAVAASMLCGSATALAQSADSLINKLVDKGILTATEAEDLRKEADQGFAKAYSKKSGMPEWVSALKLNGDFRGRYEGFFADNPAFVERNRFRYRARFGVTAEMMDNFEVGLRLGSGDIDGGVSSGIDPISQNQTLQNNASKKGIFVDLAYGKWTPVKDGDWTLSTTLGKMSNPYVFSDLVFDHDYTPEGLALQVSRQLGEKHVAKLSGGAFVLDELGGTTQDPFLYGTQVRLDSKWGSKFSTSAGAAFLAIVNEQALVNTSVPNINTGNTRAATGAPLYDFTPVVVDASASYKLDSFPWYPGAFPIKVDGEYIYNCGASSATDNEGWSAGITFGKAGKKGTWEAGYAYKWLGADAWWEELVDSDSGAYYAVGLPNSGLGAGYFAGTGIKGHVFRVSYSPHNAITLSAKALLMERIDDGGADSDLTRLQVDALWKF